MAQRTYWLAWRMPAHGGRTPEWRNQPYTDKAARDRREADLAAQGFITAKRYQYAEAREEI